MRKGAATLTAGEFRDLYEWSEEENIRLVRESLVHAKKQAPIFTLDEICATSGEELDVDTFGTREVYVKVVSLRPLRIEDPNGKLWRAVGIQAQEVDDGRRRQTEPETTLNVPPRQTVRPGIGSATAVFAVLYGTIL